MRNVKYLLLVLILISCDRKARTIEEASPSHELVVSETISTNEFQRRMHETPNAVVLDVRTPEEVREGYIDGAANIDFRADDFQMKIGKLNRDSTYFLYCAGGGRSRRAADVMKDLGFKKVYDLDGGYKAWRAAGLPVKMD